MNRKTVKNIECTIWKSRKYEKHYCTSKKNGLLYLKIATSE